MRGTEGFKLQRFEVKLNQRISRINSRLCVGLDPRPELITGDVKDFLLRVIERTASAAACFKPNIAYYEALGHEGYRMLQEVIRAIPTDIPVILDVKRGDIPETQKYYCRAYFDGMKVDAVTLNPYLGLDSLEPFLRFEGKGLYLLGITSNAGSRDIQLRGEPQVYQYVLEMMANMTDKPATPGLVIGATTLVADLQGKVPDVPLLIPGLGAQGGSLKPIAGLIRKMKSPVVINVSRGILYEGGDCAAQANKYMELINDELK